MKLKERLQAIIRKIRDSVAPNSKLEAPLLLATALVFIIGIGIYFSVLVRSLQKNKVSTEVLSANNVPPNPLPSSSPGDSFCFPHISDAHADEYQNQLINAVLYFNNTLKPPFIIDTGDTVTNSTSANFGAYKQWIDLLRSKIYIIPGNHDYQGGISEFIKNYRDVRVVFDYKGYRFIGFSSFVIDYQWLEARLSEWPKGKSILFAHMPVSWPPELTHKLLNLSASEQEQIKSLMVKYQVLAYLSGHLHESFILATTFQSGTQVGKILDIGAPALFKNPSSYQFICLDQGNISNYVVNIGSLPPITPTPASSLPKTTITFQQRVNGYLGTKDTSIGLYNSYNCSDSLLRVGYKQQNASLINFDLSSLPAGATIENAKLSLYAVSWSGQNTTLGVYKVLRNWFDCQATYKIPLAGTNWGTAGCNNTSTDRETTPQSFLVTSGIQKWYDFDLTEAVQAWVDNSLSNKGILLRQIFNNPATFSFATSESQNNPPRLTITYYFSTGSATLTPIPPTTGPSTVPTATPQPTSPTPTSQPTTPTLTPTRTPPAATSTPASGTNSLTLQQGLNDYRGTDDTYLYRYEPTANYCSSTSLKIGYKQLNVSLVRFDLSSIPQDATVDNATFSLYAVGWGGTDISMGVYQILTEWQACQVNWDQVISEQIPIVTLNTSSILKWYDFDLTLLVKSWVNNPPTNKGVLLRATNSVASSFYFSSSEQGSNRPKLLIRYH